MTLTLVTIVPAVLLTGIIALALYGCRRLRGTTLVAPCIWTAISAGSLVAVALRPAASDAVRFAAAATTFCPLMAVLGAKRPQDRGWQWVVASLWLVLVWPAGQALAMQSGELQLFAAWKLFLVGLIALGLLNYLPTRNLLATAWVAAGQTILLGEFLWQVPATWQERALPIAAGCFGVAAILSVRNVPPWRSPGSRRRHEHLGGDWHRGTFPPELVSGKPPAHSIVTYTQRWLWFRDAFGAFWALRVLGRVNETAELRRWPLRLTWQGFEVADDAVPTAKQLVEVEQALATLLRRFV